MATKKLKANWTDTSNRHEVIFTVILTMQKGATVDERREALEGAADGCYEGAPDTVEFVEVI